MAKAGKRSPKAIVQTVMAFSLILTIFFALLTVFFPFPLEHIIDRRTQNDTVVTQEGQQVWAQIPGTLNYTLNKHVQVTVPPRDPAGQTQNFQVSKKQMTRELANLEYVPITSTVNYEELYDLTDDTVPHKKIQGTDSTGAEHDRQNDDTMLKDVPNFAVFSLWTKLVGESRADYVKAYMAISRVQQALKATNMVTRYFTYNLYHWGYKNQTVVNEVALHGLEPALQEKLFNDPDYGFASIGTLGSWVAAYNAGKDSAIYQQILTHFQEGDASKFTQEQMDKIVGQGSMMAQLDRAYQGNVAHEIPKASGLDFDDQLVIGQWSSGLITKLEGIPIFDVTNQSLFQTSVQHLYNNDLDQSIPSRFSLIAGYEPELYYFMRYKLKYTEEEASIQSADSQNLLAVDASSFTTLLNPTNLQFFFEKYKQGDLDSIASRFSTGKTATLTNKHIEAIYQYLVFITEKEFKVGEFSNNTNFAQQQAYGSILSKTLKVSYDHVYRVFKDWFVARFLAAYNDVGSLTCPSYMGAAGVTLDKIVKICDTHDFKDPKIVKAFTDLLDASPDDQEKFGNDTGLLPAETKQLYNATNDAGSIPYQVNKMEQDLATAFNCKGDGKHACSLDELAVMQWTTGMITQQKNWPASVNTSDTSILTSADSVTDAKFRGDPGEFDQLFQHPELFLHMGNVSITMDAGWKLLNRTNGTSLDNKWRAAFVTEYVMSHPASAENNKRFEGIYGITDFYGFFTQMRLMGQDYLLGGAFANKTKSELTYGYDETRYTHIFANATDPTDDFFEGNDVDVDSFITPILPISSERIRNSTVSIYTGSEDMDHVARVRFVNAKDYVNVKQTVFDGRNYTGLPASPTEWLQQFETCTNGFQWSTKDTDSSDDDASFCSYDASYLGLFTFKENKDFGKNQKYGTDDNSKFTVKQYTTTDVPDTKQTAFLKGFSQDVKFENATIKVQPTTGIIISKNFTTMNQIMLQGGEQVQAEQLNGRLLTTPVYLPLPEWDKRSHQFKLYSESTTLEIDPEQYTDRFGYIHNLKQTIVVTEIVFTSLFAVSALVFVISLALYCCKYRNQKDEEAAVYHQAQTSY